MWRMAGFCRKNNNLPPTNCGWQVIRFDYFTVSNSGRALQGASEFANVARPSVLAQKLSGPSRYSLPHSSTRRKCSIRRSRSPARSRNGGSVIETAPRVATLKTVTENLPRGNWAARSQAARSNSWSMK